MLVFKELGGDTQDGISCHLKFDELCDNCDDRRSLHYGINSTIRRRNAPFNRNFLLNLWSPCEFTVPHVGGKDGIQQMDGFDIVYGVCPYTTKWLREVTGDQDKYRNVCHPHQVGKDLMFCSDLGVEKDYEVCYFGGIHGKAHQECIDVIKYFNYRFLSQQHYPEVTNFKVSNKEKLRVVANCKVSVCYNFIPMREDLKNNIKTYDRWEENKAFQYMDSHNAIPQMKARFFEAASQYTLNLVQKDPWNVVTGYMTPGIDYLEFEDQDDLRKILTEVLHCYSKYDDMRHSAFVKSKMFGPQGTYDYIERDSK